MAWSDTWAHTLYSRVTGLELCPSLSSSAGRVNEWVWKIRIVADRAAMADGRRRRPRRKADQAQVLFSDPGGEMWREGGVPK
eukprot:scaffold9864_cov124-Isochrysis_galbana.AAC.3